MREEKNGRGGDGLDGSMSGSAGAGGGAERPASSLTVGELIGEIRDQIALLVRKQIELAKTELRTDFRTEVKMAGGLGLAAIGALVFINLLLVTVVLALAKVMPAWGAGLVIAGVVLLASAAAALFGWSRRIRSPLHRTRESIKEDIAWTKRRLA